MIEKKYLSNAHSNLTYSILSASRISKVLKNKKQFRFRVLIVVGDRINLIGFGLVKANQLKVAIKKALIKAKKNLFKVNINEIKTIPHSLTINYKASKIIFKSAKQDYGIIASNPIRIILELAGIKNIITKNLGSRNIINVTKSVYILLKNISL